MGKVKNDSTTRAKKIGNRALTKERSRSTKKQQIGRGKKRDQSTRASRDHSSKSMSKPKKAQKAKVLRKTSSPKRKVALTFDRVNKKAYPVRKPVKKVVAKKILQVNQRSLKRADSKTDQKKQLRPVMPKTKAIKKVKKEPKQPVKVLSEKQLLREQKKQEKLERLQKKQQEKEKKKDKERQLDLNPNPKVPTIRVNTLIEPHVQDKKKQTSRSFELKGCCIFCNNREVLQCVKYNDIPGFKKCLADLERISNPFQNYSLTSKDSLVKEIVKQQNVEMLKILIEYTQKVEKGKIKRVKLPILSLQKTTTGVANRKQFYFRIRQVKLSRGGKEGNNAFTYDNSMRKSEKQNLFDCIIKQQLSSKIIQLIHTSDKNYFNDTSIILGKAARRGNFVLLKFLFETKIKDNFGYNKLHYASILQGNEVDSIKIINKGSIQRKGCDVFQLMPVHLAAINPDPSIFKRFFKGYPSSNLQDAELRDVVHYAAANINSDVLDFLISKKQSINNSDSNGTTPLMIACKLGRTANVKSIIEEQSRQLASLDPNDEDYHHYLKESKYVDQTGQFKNTPLHIAAKNGHLSIVKILVEQGECEKDLKNYYGNSALGEAAEKGFLEIVEYLILKGADIHGKDKQMKSPLIRACINGQIHVVAFLLKQGVNPNFKDASENTALHYACAYGWLNIVKLLIEMGSDPNLLNEWKSSCILIAMLKGHIGIVDYLINLNEINASFQDDEGRTLIAQLCMNINDDSAKILKFLINKKKINILLKDQHGFSPLHHLAANDIKEIADKAVRDKETDKDQKSHVFFKKGKKIKRKNNYYNYWGNQNDQYPGYFTDQKDKVEFQKKLTVLTAQMIECASLLQKEGLKLSELTEEHELTPLFIALDNNNFKFVEWIYQQESQNGQVISGKSNKGKNVLHLLSKNIFDQEINLLPILLKSNKEKFKQLSREEDDKGYSPFQLQFKYLKGLSSKYFNHWRYSADFRKFFQKENLTRGIQMIIQNTQLYSEELDYDISTQIGMSKEQKEKLEKLKADGLISSKDYDLLKLLQYDEFIHQKKDQQMEIDEEEVSYKYDNLTKFDPKKRNLGLNSSITGNENKGNNNDEDDEDEDDDDSSVGRRNHGIFAYARATSKAKRSKKGKAYVVDNISFETEDKYQINTEDFYSQPDCKKTCLHLLLEFFKENKNLDIKEGIGLVKESLQLSLKFKSTEINSMYQGFNKFDKESRNILFLAIKNEQKDFILTIFESDALDLNLQSTKRKLGVFHYLSKVKNQAIIDSVLSMSHEVDIDMRDKNLNTPLHYASYLRNDYFVQKLISQGAEINASSKFGYNALHFSLISFDDALDHTPKIERLLIEKSINVNLVDNDGRTPIFYLFFKNKLDVAKQDPANLVMVLLQTNQIKVNVQDRNLNTPLHYACKIGSTISALELLNHGSDFTLTNIFGNNAFAEALAHQQTDLCVFLIQQGCDFRNKVKVPKPIQKSEEFEQFMKKLLPADLRTEIYGKRKTYRSYEDYLKQNYIIKETSPFQLALNHNQGGIGFLLLSKEYNIYDSMISCLKSCKLEKFNDLFDSVSKTQVIRQKDKRQRSLLYLLILNVAKALSQNQPSKSKDSEDEDQYDEDVDEEEDEETKAIPKNSANSVVDRCIELSEMLINEYQFDIAESDTKNRNILHELSQKSSEPQVFNLLEKVMKTVPKHKLIEMCNHKDSIRNATPFVYLFNQEFLKKQNFDILDQVDMGIIDQTYSHPVPGFGRSTSRIFNVPIPDSLKQNTRFPFYKEASGRISTISSKVIQNMDDIKPEQQGKIIHSLISKKINFQSHDNNSGISDLMLAVLHQKLEIVLILLGYAYDQKKEQYVAKDLPLVRVNNQDLNGKTALHYSIRPSKYGSWMNKDILEALLNAKADPSIEDNEGLNVLDYACDQPLAYKIIQEKHLSLRPKKNLAPQFEKIERGFEKKKSFTGSEQVIKGQRHQYQEDAELYIQDMIQAKKRRQEEKEGGSKGWVTGQKKEKKEVEVDAVSKLEQRCEVHRSEDGVYFDALLTVVDVKKYFYGQCNFYIVQLLFDKVKKIFILWTRWGRIGDEGQFQRTPFNSKEEAEKEFCKVFKQKTGTHWADIKNYRPVAHKYKVKRVGGKFIFQDKEGIHWSESDRLLDTKDLAIDFESKQYPRSSLSESQYDFIKCLVNQALQIRKLRSMGIEKNFMLQSILEPQTIERIKGILNQIYGLCKEEQKYKDAQNFEKYQEVLEQIGSLSNEYYEATMPTQFAGQGTHSVYDTRRVQAELSKIDLIYDFEHVVKLLFAAMYRVNEVNPYEYIYTSLKSNLKQLDPAEEEYQLLLKYMNPSQSRTPRDWRNIVLQNIFKVENSSQKDQISVDQDKEFSSLHNHFMLFHGTSNANVLSIIEQGLLIQPKHSSTYHGSAFGNGLYFGDQFWLASQYSDMNQIDENDDTDFCVLACEVALGNVCNAIQRDRFESIPEKYNSLRIMSTYGPQFGMNLVRNDGCIWPLGSIVRYEDAVYKVKDKTYRSLDEVNEGQKQKKKAQKKKPAPKKKPKLKMISLKKRAKEEDESMDSGSEGSEEAEDESDKSDEEPAHQENTGKRDLQFNEMLEKNEKKYSIDPNAISVSDFRSQARAHTNYYQVQEAQYIVPNANQVRVKYILHFCKKAKK